MEQNLVVKRVIALIGGKSATARRLGLAKQTVNNWRCIPPKHLMKIAAITGIPVEELRPDLAYIAPIVQLDTMTAS